MLMKHYTFTKYFRSTFQVRGTAEDPLTTTYKQLNYLKLMKFESEQNLAVNPIGIYLLKVNNSNTRTSCEICSKLTIKTPERCH